jgi:cyclic beta-1,2-glucan synthetase
MDGMAQLERYRGHWLNWYELRDLNRLEPAYVSTVDSGNLAVSLVTLARGLDELTTSPLTPARLLRGLSDTVGVIAETVEALPGVVPRHINAAGICWHTIKRSRQQLCQRSSRGLPVALRQWRGSQFDELAEEVIGLAEDEEVVVSAEAINELRIWLDELQCPGTARRSHDRRAASLVAGHGGDRRSIAEVPSRFRSGMATTVGPVEW